MPLSPIREITNLVTQPILPRFDSAEQNHHPKISGVNDFNFAGKETQHSTHGLHPYVAAINPPLANALINHYVPRGELLLDPFCGGGGVLVESVLCERRAEGYDINPLAVLLSRVKTTHLPEAQTVREYQRILREAQQGRTAPVEEVPDLIRFWYREESLTPLCRLRDAISNIFDPSVRELFQVVLSATARDVMLTYRGEIRLRRLQGRDLERFQPNVYEVFRKRAELAMGRVAQLPAGISATVELRDARQIEVEGGFHTVITSPPYADDTNGVGYFQFSRNMLYWIGVSLDFQKQRRQSFLGCGKFEIEKIPTPPSRTLQDILSLIEARSPKHWQQAVLFYHDYYTALRSIARAVQSRAIIIIGDRVLSRTYINNGHITTEFMDALDFGLEHYYTREITKKRIPNLGGDGGGTAVEHILIYRRR